MPRPPMLNDFSGSAVVPTAFVGVPPTESFARNRTTSLVNPQVSGGRISCRAFLLARRAFGATIITLNYQ